ncbi:possible cytosine/ adenosine deaminase [Rhodococcus jostii RHA1]|uniref:Possible cytosine/ adenosine deaminase n=1 Tax=Rhodococcus jostii (strain RHA1) TaxID=101510 RepID=Q0S0S4_RHOJR|nr:possible cytosine/ adenosine deaminase [Rhodococcus jostii RHA1]
MHDGPHEAPAPRGRGFQARGDRRQPSVRVHPGGRQGQCPARNSLSYCWEDLRIKTVSAWPVQSLVVTSMFPCSSTCTLYTTAEPCSMCAGAIDWGNVLRLVYGITRRSR